MSGHLRLEVVVVGLFGKSGEHLHPSRLLDEQTKGVVGPEVLLDRAFAE